MLSRSTSLWLLSCLVIISLLLFARFAPREAESAPAPTPRPPYALLFVPKRVTPAETASIRRWYMDRLRERTVLLAALRNPKATNLLCIKKQKDPADWLKHNLRLDYLDGTGALRISLGTGSRREQALLVNAVAHALFLEVVDRSKEAQEKTLEVLREMRTEIQRERKIEKGDNKKALELELGKIKARILSLEAEFRTRPQLLEWADVPPQ